jgi:hypothetical protein
MRFLTSGFFHQTIPLTGSSIFEYGFKFAKLFDKVVGDTAQAPEAVSMTPLGMPERCQRHCSSRLKKISLFQFLQKFSQKSRNFFTKILAKTKNADFCTNLVYFPQTFLRKRKTPIFAQHFAKVMLKIFVKSKNFLLQRVPDCKSHTLK